ncbi:hypothetical protein [Psychromonas sp. SP041]|uniref:hypothetical protein n=1 Tax=Psychromonas sp. SP041 TaxID=1365007 RepID=UPI0010C77A7E|nr:hypothetical protein [Psychromonas sp. SP041]
MKKIISLAITSLIFLLVSNTASAVPITGRIDFTGTATVVKSGTTVSTITFSPYSSVVSDPSLVTGDFTPELGGAVAFTNFDASTPLNLLWTTSNFTFTITNVLVNAFNSTLELSGLGTISSSIAGLDDTAGTWVITANGGSTNVSFSSTTIPAPAGAALLGLSLLGFGFARRNKKAK